MRYAKTLGHALACCAGLASTMAAAGDGRLTLPESPKADVIYTIDERPSGLSPETALKLYVGAASQCCQGKTPMSGSYRTDGGRVTFDPAFDFLVGQPYTIQTWHGETTEFTLAPVTAAMAPKVVAIYPSGDTIPENTLRFYIQFSAPMMPHQSERFIALLNADGGQDRDAFMTFKQELWNTDRTRLTLLMDPGRIKRGVAQNLRLGPALSEGQTQAIAVSEGWPAATGRSAAGAFDRRFTIGPPLRSRPSTEAWQIPAPTAGSLDPLVITFDRPFDRVQTLNSLILHAKDGSVLRGDAHLGAGEMTWTFTPDQPWPRDEVQLWVDARLEDVAGNNFRETLDHAAGTRAREVTWLVVPLNTSDP